MLIDLGSPYKAIKTLGQGAQGQVWLALDQRSGRQVAVKVLV